MTYRLNRKLVLEDRGGAPDGAGGREAGWVPLGTHWAELRAGSGRFERGEADPRSRVPYRAFIRSLPQDAPSRPKAGQRFVEGARIYLIRSVADVTTDARYLVCALDEERVA